MAERPSRPSRVVEEPVKEAVEVSEFNYEEDLRIDPNYLDAEFLNHSMVFMKYAKESANANRTAKQTEENVKTIRSQIIKTLKESGEKHTETTLEAGYRLDPGYIQAKQEWIEATFYADLCNNAVFAMQSRKSALENLIRLHGQEYFSTPQEPRDLPEALKRLDAIKNGSAVNHIKERMRRN